MVTARLDTHSSLERKCLPLASVLLPAPPKPQGPSPSSVVQVTPISLSVVTLGDLGCPGTKRFIY